MGRILAALLVRALRSEVTQNAVLETTKFLTRRASLFILRKMRANSRRFRD